jgi:filamentous hemagglutinin
VDRHAGRGQPAGTVPRGRPGFRERVDFGEVIGEYVNEATEAATPTTKGIVHYDAKGKVHIVPVRP